VDPLVVYQMAVSNDRTVEGAMKVMGLVQKMGLHGKCEAMAVASMQTDSCNLGWGVHYSSISSSLKVQEVVRWFNYGFQEHSGTQSV
jgi:hypothetical protein